MITGAPRRDRGGRLFAEAAVLGWRDYPVFYDERSARLHFIAGIHLPGFGLVDALRFQAERVPVTWHVVGPYEWTPLPYAEPAILAPTHVWFGEVFLSRAVLSWADAQAWTRFELGEGRARAGLDYNHVRNRVFQAGLRFSARL